MQTAAKTLTTPLRNHTSAKVHMPLNRDIETVVARVLTQGGDTRIELNTAGTNSYGCAPHPDLALVQFGSSTGSVISTAGFQAAVAVYRRLHGVAGSYHLEVERQRRELSALCGASDLPGSEVVLAASGTDIHLFAAHLAAQGQSAGLQAVMAEPGETGSGVPAALAALHFSTRTSQGHNVKRGVPIDNTRLRQPACVSLRQADSSLRSVADVDAEFAAQVDRVMQADGHCLLVLTDLSKTGLLAPSPACAVKLQKLYGDHLTVLVDACQFRLSSATLVDYLAKDFMVAITGSKFVGGPAFCGALLLPASLAQRCRTVPLNALFGYSSRSDWPPGWLPAKVLAESANLGLLLRWEAALAELRRFKAIPDQAIHDFLERWQQAIKQRLVSDDGFEMLPVTPLRRGTGAGQPTWDSLQTVFAFQIFKRNLGGERRALSPQETSIVYQQLRRSQTDLGGEARFQLGQPVHCGVNGGVHVCALRLCSGARLVTEAMAAGQTVTHAIRQAMRALDQVALVAQALP